MSSPFFWAGNYPERKKTEKKPPLKYQTMVCVQWSVLYNKCTTTEVCFSSEHDSHIIEYYNRGMLYL